MSLGPKCYRSLERIDDDAKLVQFSSLISENPSALPSTVAEDTKVPMEPPRWDDLKHGGLSTCGVAKMRYGGSYRILLAKLGQELVGDANQLHDLHAIIESYLHRMKTSAGTTLVTNLMRDAAKFQEEPTQDHRVLAGILRQQNFKDWTMTPSWANGAVVICTPSDASEIQKALRGVSMQKGDVIVSKELRSFVQGLIESREKLQTYPNISDLQQRKERPVIKGNIVDLPRPPLSAVDAERLRTGGLRSRSAPPALASTTSIRKSAPECEQASLSSSQTHSSGSRPKGNDASKRDYGVVCKKFTLIAHDVAEVEYSGVNEDTGATHNENPASTLMGAAEGEAEMTITKPGINRGEDSISAASESHASVFSSIGESLPEGMVEADLADSVHQDFGRKHQTLPFNADYDSIEKRVGRMVPEIVEPVFKAMDVPAMLHNSADQRQLFLEALAAHHRNLCDLVRIVFSKARLLTFFGKIKNVEGLAHALEEHMRREFKTASRADRVALKTNVPSPLVFTSTFEMVELLQCNLVQAVDTSLKAAWAKLESNGFEVQDPLKEKMKRRHQHFLHTSNLEEIKEEEAMAELLNAPPWKFETNKDGSRMTEKDYLKMVRKGAKRDDRTNVYGKLVERGRVIRYL